MLEIIPETSCIFISPMKVRAYAIDLSEFPLTVIVVFQIFPNALPVSESIHELASVGLVASFEKPLALGLAILKLSLEEVTIIEDLLAKSMFSVILPCAFAVPALQNHDSLSEWFEHLPFPCFFPLTICP